MLSLPISVLGKPLASLVGQSVFLQATVGLVGDDHLHQAVDQGRFEISDTML